MQLSHDRSAIASGNALLSSQNDVLKTKIKETEDLLTSLKSREKNSNDILKRINEADGILTIAKNKEDANKANEIRIKELNVKIIADTRRLNAKESLLNTKEEKLNEREDNLKIAEATLSK